MTEREQLIVDLHDEAYLCRNKSANDTANLLGRAIAALSEPKYKGIYDLPKPTPRWAKDFERMNFMERNLCRAGEVKNGSGQTIKLARVWSIMGELETLRETVDAMIEAAQDK